MAFSTPKYVSHGPQISRSASKTKSARKSFFKEKQSIEKRPNVNISFNRSLNTSLIVEDDSHKFDLENIGLTIPVMASEALRCDRNASSNSTVNFFDEGWIVLVVGRRLFIWKQGQTLNCKELDLPVSDLAHRAELVSLVMSREDGSLGCLAASPEGVLHYWQRIMNSEVFIDESPVELRGEECARLLPCHFSDTFALVTRSSSVLVVSCKKGGLTFRMLRSDAGWIRGFGRRMSSFFGAGSDATGGLSLQAVLTRQLIVDEEACTGCELLLVASGQLQRWEITPEEDKKELDINIDRLLREELVKASNRNLFDMDHNIIIWDMDIRGKDIFIFGKISGADTQIFLGVFNLENLEFVSVCAFTPPVGLPLESNGDLESAVLRIPLDGATLRSSTLVYLVWASAVLVVEALNGRTAGRLDLSAVGERLLGSCPSAHQTGVMLFTKRNGLLALRPRPEPAESGHSFFRTPLAAAPRSAVRTGPAERTAHFPTKVLQRSASQNQEHSFTVATATTQDVDVDSGGVKGKLLTAFQLYCHGNVNQAYTRVSDLHSQQNEDFAGALLTLADDILDDAPANDPRWAETLGPGARAVQLAASSDSVFIDQQLADKARALDTLCDFLQAAQLWDKLGGVTMEDGVEYCVAATLELRGERLAGVRALRETQSQHPFVLEPVLRDLVQSETDSTPPGLTPNDLFYRRVTYLDAALTTLVRRAEAEALSDNPLRQVSELLVATSQLVVTSLREAAVWRRSRPASGSGLHAPSLLASPEPVGLRSMAVQLAAALTRHLTQALGDVGVRGRLLGLLVEVVDLVLAAVTAQLARSSAIDPERPYNFAHGLGEELNKLKSTLISPLAGALDEPERALQLAERYQEWDLLVRVCEATGNKERLQRYLRQFAAAGFPEYLFDWYIREGKRGRLLSAQLDRQQQARLGEFLDCKETRSLQWLQHVNTGQMERGAESLRCLAAEERELLPRKRTLLSLSKLALLASETMNEEEKQSSLAAINAELEIVRIQSSLPGGLLDALGIDANAMPVFTPQELVDLFTSEHTPERSPVHFKQALDLLHYVNADSDMLDELRVHIWAKAILVDEWALQIAADDPLDEMRDTIFLHVINLCHADGMDLRMMLPKLEVLLDAPELGLLKDNANFRYLMRAGYESMEKLYDASTM